MKTGFKILIADRNPHVREYLKRELTAAGYQIHLAENARQLFKRIYHNEPLDLLIIDPDLPDAEVSSLLSQIQEQFPILPVVIHTLLSDRSNNEDIMYAFPFVEKQGSSIEHLKKVVFDILHNFNKIKIIESP